VHQDEEEDEEEEEEVGHPLGPSLNDPCELLDDTDEDVPAPEPGMFFSHTEHLRSSLFSMRVP
jgi:hypothetical protein